MSCLVKNLLRISVAALFFCTSGGNAAVPADPEKQVPGFDPELTFIRVSGEGYTAVVCDPAQPTRDCPAWYGKFAGQRHHSLILEAPERAGKIEKLQHDLINKANLRARKDAERKCRELAGAFLVNGELDHQSFVAVPSLDDRALPGNTEKVRVAVRTRYEANCILKETLPW